MTLDHTSPAPPTEGAALKTVPRLTPGETKLLYVAVVLLFAVGTLGLIASFQAVTEKATQWGFETPEILPIAIDLAIPGFTIAHLLLIRMDMELAWVRAVPWALTAVTVYLNVQASGVAAAKLGHGALPLIWVVCSEIAAHVYRVLIGQATGKRMERVRRSRWFLAPFSTGSLWRRMILWEETSYLAAVHRERDRLLGRADLRETYGLFWRFKAPLRDRINLRLGDQNPAETFVAETGTETGGTPAIETKTPLALEPSRETETGETKTSPALVQQPGRAQQAETKTSLTKAETPSRDSGETPETTTATGPTETSPETAGTETTATTVSPIGDRDVQAEVDHLLALMRDRGSETAVGLKEAITETGRPKSTAAKRLAAARDQYRKTAA